MAAHFSGGIVAGLDSVLRAVLKNAGWAVTGQGVAAVCLFAETILLARCLSPDVFGQFLILVSAVELVFGLLDFRSGEAVVKFTPELEGWGGGGAVSAFLRLIVLFDSTMALIGWCAVGLFGMAIVGWASMPGIPLSLLLVLATGSALKTTVRSFGSYLRVSGEFPKSVKLGMLSAILRLLFIACAVVWLPTLTTAVWAAAFADVAFFVLISSYTFASFRARKYDLLKSSLKRISSRQKAIFTFLLSNNLAGTLRTISTKVDVIVLASLSTPSMVALYKFSVRMAGMLLMFSDPLLVAVYPEMSQFHARNALSTMKKTLLMLTVSLATIAAAIIIGFLVIGGPVVEILAGEEYVRAGSLISIMFAGTGAAMIFFWARPLLLIYGQAGKLVVIALIALGVQFGSLYLLVPLLDAYGAALSFAFYYLTGVLLSLLLLQWTRRGPKLQAGGDPSTIGEQDAPLR